MKHYLHFLTRHKAAVTPQSAPIAGAISNSAGGCAFPLDDWTRLDRFLVFGSEGGSDYAGETALTRDNAQAVLCAIATALALMTAATQTHILSFTGGMVKLPLSASMRLDEAVRVVSGLPFDHTDSGTWAAEIHPVQALRQYRERTAIADFIRQA
jgi:hypothetical protein